MRIFRRPLRRKLIRKTIRERFAATEVNRTCRDMFQFAGWFITIGVSQKGRPLLLLLLLLREFPRGRARSRLWKFHRYALTKNFLRAFGLPFRATTVSRLFETMWFVELHFECCENCLEINYELPRLELKVFIQYLFIDESLKWL